MSAAAPLFGKRERAALVDPIVAVNPISVQVLGICSALAVTTRLDKAIVMGVGVMFVLNLSVSFFLALATAARAYHLRTADHAELLRGLLSRLMRTPLDFVIPPRPAQPAAEPTRDVQAV